MTSPSPPHVGHALTETNCPNTLRAARRTSPAPPQVGQRCGLVPAFAPEPLHLPQRSRVLSFTVFLTPVCHLGEREPHRDPDVLAAARLAGGALPARPAEHLTRTRRMPPKSRMKMLSASDRSTWW